MYNSSVQSCFKGYLSSDRRTIFQYRFVLKNIVRQTGTTRQYRVVLKIIIRYVLVVVGRELLKDYHLDKRVLFVSIGLLKV